AFVRPGDYRVAVVIFDSRTGEHGSAQRTLRVNPLKNDPLPTAWQTLPPVEFVPPAESPDDLFAPGITGRLNLPLESRRPLRIEVLMNASPTVSGHTSQIGEVNSRSIQDLLPALKVLSQVAVRNGELNVSLLDLTRRRVVFEQEKLGVLDWPKLR